MRTYKLLSAAQLKEWDKKTMEIKRISSLELMETAGYKLFKKLLKKEKKNLKKHPIVIFCGVRNNGGDGLVMARLLSQNNFNVKVFIVAFTSSYSIEFEENLKKLKETNIEIISFDKTISIPEDSIVIDAIFGTGLTRPAEKIAKKAIEWINQSKKHKVISIDIPSGLYVDKPNNKEDAIIKSDCVYSIELPKRSFFFPENISYIKSYEIVKIGLATSVLKKLKTSYYTYKIQVKDDLEREERGYKYTFGHTLLIGGSDGMFGAILLASKAALRIGSGLVTAVVPKKALIPAQTFIPELMILTSNHKKHIKSIPKIPISVNSIGIGPGLGRKKETQKIILNFINKYGKPLIIDADAINILALNDALNIVPENSILTPHEGEFKRILGGKFTWKNSLEKIKLAKKIAKKHQLVIVLKGPYTIITNGEKVFFNPYVNSALAKAGTGDVLTGMITGIFAQKQNPLFSALIGVQLHTKAAKDFNDKKFNKYSLLASDLIENLKNIH